MNIVPRRGFGCGDRDSVWVDTLVNMKVGESFDAPMKKRESIYHAAKRLGFIVAGRQLGRKQRITFYMVSK